MRESAVLVLVVVAIALVGAAIGSCAGPAKAGTMRQQSVRLPLRCYAYEADEETGEPIRVDTPAGLEYRLVDSLGILVANLVILLVAYVVTSYGLVPMTRWGIRQLAGQLGDLANVMARALPLLLIFTTLLFFTTEIWQIASSLGAPFFVVTAIIPFVAGTLFLLLRVPDELDAVAHFERWAAVRDLAAGTPVGDLELDGLGDPPRSPPLKRRAWLNVGLVLVVSQSVQILLVAVVIGLFYVAFGVFAVSLPVTEE